MCVEFFLEKMTVKKGFQHQDVVIQAAKLKGIKSTFIFHLRLAIKITLNNHIYRERCTAHCSQLEHSGGFTMQSFQTMRKCTSCVPTVGVAIKPLW